MKKISYPGPISKLQTVCRSNFSRKHTLNCHDFPYRIIRFFRFLEKFSKKLESFKNLKTGGSRCQIGFVVDFKITVENTVEKDAFFQFAITLAVN